MYPGPVLEYTSHLSLLRENLPHSTTFLLICETYKREHLESLKLIHGIETTTFPISMSVNTSFNSRSPIFLFGVLFRT